MLFGPYYGLLSRWDMQLSVSSTLILMSMSILMKAFFLGGTCSSLLAPLILNVSVNFNESRMKIDT